MKILTTIGACAALTGMALMPLHAEKKPPQISSKELTDPNSRSYVPYPYPKTEFEIIEDFKYGVRVHHGPPREGVKRSMIKGAVFNAAVLLGLLADPPVSKVIDILRVEDLVATSPAIYYYILLISDHEGKIAALGAVGDTGLFFSSAIVTEQTKVPLPFKRGKSLEAIVSRAVGPVVINKMERIAVHSSISSPPLVPLNRIMTSKGVLFVDCLDRVHAVEKQAHWDRRTTKNPDPRLHTIIIDAMNNKLVYLKRIG